jgi:hypothetical protein
MMHTVHYLTLVTLNSDKGWAAPVELPPDQPQGGVLVVPVSNELSFFAQYRLDWSLYRGAGRYDKSHGTMQLLSNGWLKVLVDGQSVKFGKRLIDNQPRCFRYVGTLTHSDFASPLCEIEAEDESILDDLYDRKGIVVEGCDPASEYGGLNQFLASPAGQKKIR